MYNRQKLAQLTANLLFQRVKAFFWRVNLFVGKSKFKK